MSNKQSEFNIDPHTNEQFEPRRTNQRFANSKNKNDYHNQKARDERQKDAPTNKQLLLNKRILRDKMKNKKERVFYDETLKELGFDFGVGTGLEQVEGKPVLAVYEFKVIPFSKTQRKVVKYD